MKRFYSWILIPAVLTLTIAALPGSSDPAWTAGSKASFVEDPEAEFAMLSPDVKLQFDVTICSAVCRTTILNAPIDPKGDSRAGFSAPASAIGAEAGSSAPRHHEEGRNPLFLAGVGSKLPLRRLEWRVEG